MLNQINKIRHGFQEIIDMHKLINREITEVWNMLDKNKYKYVTIDVIEQIFGKYEYKEIAGGRVHIIDNWRNENIKFLKIGTTEVWINRLIFPQTAYVFAKIYAENLENELDLKGGGGFVARHQLWNPAYPLSCHAYGCAIDFNPEKFPYGSDLKPHPRVIEIFQEGGFYWGGDFSRTKDNMHFQFAYFII